jgi:hypothetical protein
LFGIWKLRFGHWDLRLVRVRDTEIGIGLHSPIKDFEDRAKAKGKPALDSDRGTEKEERR